MVFGFCGLSERVLLLLTAAFVPNYVSNITVEPAYCIWSDPAADNRSRPTFAPQIEDEYDGLRRSSNTA